MCSSKDFRYVSETSPVYIYRSLLILVPGGTQCTVGHNRILITFFLRMNQCVKWLNPHVCESTVKNLGVRKLDAVEATQIPGPDPSRRLGRQPYIFLPPANEVWGKGNVFTLVCLLIGGLPTVGACLQVNLN